jgi:phosphoribosylglycinamide formyltransferase-1
MKIQPANRRLGILLSGRGSNFEAIADQIDSGKLQAEIAIVVSNKESAPGLLRAKQRGFPNVLIASRGRVREEFDAELVEVLRRYDVGLIVLAGFMRIFSPVFINAFPFRILNIHPSLMPSFPGLDAQKQALEHGVKYAGCTVHLVTGTLDDGPIVKQAVVPVLDDDTVESLSARILKEEHRIYSEAIALVLSGRCEIAGRRCQTPSFGV